MTTDAKGVTEDEVVMHLDESSLYSKWGFNDGDEPDRVMDLLDEHKISLDNLDWHDVLRRLVRTHLIPFVPGGVEVIEVFGIHNPIRAADWWDYTYGGRDDPPHEGGFVVVPITWGQVVEAINEEATSNDG